jgi:hypothetical protein
VAEVRRTPGPKEGQAATPRPKEGQAAMTSMTDPQGEQAVPEQHLAEPQRKEIFLALVLAQDRQMSVAASRKEVSRRFGLSERQIRQIAQEGIDNEWPPL